MMRSIIHRASFILRAAHLEVLAVDALAVVGAEDASLEAFTVLLEARGLLAVAALGVPPNLATRGQAAPLRAVRLMALDLGPERVGVALQDGLHRGLPDRLVLPVVEAVDAVAVVAVAARGKALAVPGGRSRAVCVRCQVCDECMRYGYMQSKWQLGEVGRIAYGVRVLQDAVGMGMTEQLLASETAPSGSTVQAHTQMHTLHVAVPTGWPHVDHIVSPGEETRQQQKRALTA